MNPEWGTPPGGDFARYVEQLTARALAEAARPSGFMLLEDEAPAPPAAARVLGRPRPAAAPEAEKKPDAAAAAAPKRSGNLALKLLAGWAVVAGLFAAGRPGLALLALFAGALWFVASRLKGMLADFAVRAKTQAQRRQAAARGRFPS